MKHPLPSHGVVRSTQSPSFPGAKTHAMPAPVHVVTGSSVLELPLVAGGHAHRKNAAQIGSGKRRILDVYHVQRRQAPVAARRWAPRHPHRSSGGRCAALCHAMKSAPRRHPSLAFIISGPSRLQATRSRRWPDRQPPRPRVAGH